MKIINSLPIGYNITNYNQNRILIYFKLNFIIILLGIHQKTEKSSLRVSPIVSDIIITSLTNSSNFIRIKYKRSKKSIKYRITSIDLVKKMFLGQLKYVNL